ncbi:ribonuclease H-like domain-containing protein [Tanacetum coccineum]
MMKLMSLVNEVPFGNMQANMAGHPNGTLAKIKYVGNLRLSDKDVLFDVLVVPEYYFSLLSVNKLIKDSRILGHPSNQVVDVLKHDLTFTKDSKVSPYDICHKAKQTGEHFPISDHQNTVIGLFGVKTVIYDNGTEFVNNKMSNLFNNLGIVHQTSCVYTPQQNGFLPPVVNGKSPFELVYGFKPKLFHLRCFGCLCFSSILNNSDKFSAISEKCVLIGFYTTKNDADL